MLQSPIKPKSYGLDKGIIQLTQMFGDRALDYSKLGLYGHNGIDFRTKHIQGGKAPVVASHDGVIISDPGIQSDTAGRFVKILSDARYLNGRRCKLLTMYFHLTSAKHKPGLFVKRGQVIGIAGNTGSFTTGPHLHFGLYPLWEDLGWAVEQNGYGGAIDPIQFLTDGYVYQYGDSMYGRKFFHNGIKIPRNKVDALIPEQYRT